MSDFKVTHKIEIELVEYISAKTFNSARGDAEAWEFLICTDLQMLFKKFLI